MTRFLADAWRWPCLVGDKEIISISRAWFSCCGRVLERELHGGISGVERDEDEYDGSASEAEGESLMLGSHDSISRRRQSVFAGSCSAAAAF
jgi:hypothetical protein